DKGVNLNQPASSIPGAVHRPPPPQTGKMSRRKLSALIRGGYGQGHFQRYKPWLRVTKRDYSPFSIIGHLPAPELGRLHHFRSIAEARTIQLAKWLGASDVREQYPMWPWEHAHPGEGLPGFDKGPRVRGLVDIAEEAGISHGVHVGTSLPYVATLDILTSWEKEDGEFFLIALDNKPADIVAAPILGSRAKDRLELARRYSIECQFPHLIVHAEKLPYELTYNLDALEPRMNAAVRKNAIGSSLYKEIVQNLGEHAYLTPPLPLLRRIAARRSIDLSRVQKLYRLALWRLDIDHDLTLVLDSSEPLQKGGVEVWRDLRKAWLKENA
ncbi:hypothetical protein, partial [Acidovorax kalamii]|uniref:hypothetical protein n=1 Tax=Acidovorax kalamii TaxID=2004485 RepID=UPI002090C986